MPAGDLEAQVEQLYEKIELPKSWRKRLRDELEAEITARQHRNAAEREFLTRKLAKADTERRKLLDAYYANAIDVTTLKAEQARIAADVRSAEERLAAVDAHLAEWQEILETAMRFATNCAKAYARASAPTRRRFNQAVFSRIDVRDGKIAAVVYHPPFDLLFSTSEFEYGDLVEATTLCSNPSVSPAFERFLRIAQAHMSVVPGTLLNSKHQAIRISRQKQHRLTPPEVELLCREYKDGAAIAELAAKFHIHRSTALALFDRFALERRGKGPSEVEVGRAIDLYQKGRSTVNIGSLLGFSAETIRQALIRAGVRMRGPHDRPGSLHQH
ncbi:MAG TPA: hypothetical protein VGG38_07325 [Acidimicrobiales bacterium]|jgi:hypothetical protein